MSSCSMAVSESPSDAMRYEVAPNSARIDFDRPVDASRVSAQVRRPYERHATRHAQSRGRTA